MEEDCVENDAWREDGGGENSVYEELGWLT